MSEPRDGESLSEPISILKDRLIHLQSQHDGSLHADEIRSLTQAIKTLRMRPTYEPSAIELVRAIVSNDLPQGSQGVSRPEERMASERTLAIKEASRDYRLTRTAPTISVPVFLAVMTAITDVFGPKEPVAVLNNPMFLITVGAFIIAMILGSVLRFAQNLAEEQLRRYYDVDVQGSALGHLAARFGEDSFLLEHFRLALADAASSRRMPDGDTVRSLGPMGRILSRNLTKWSTVDLGNAVNDASILAVERFIGLGDVRTEHTAGLTWLVLTEDFFKNY